jgi:hypothetical protein
MRTRGSFPRGKAAGAWSWPISFEIVKDVFPKVQEPRTLPVQKKYATSYISNIQYFYNRGAYKRRYWRQYNKSQILHYDDTLVSSAAYKGTHSSSYTFRVRTADLSTTSYLQLNIESHKTAPANTEPYRILHPCKIQGNLFKMECLGTKKDFRFT